MKDETPRAGPGCGQKVASATGDAVDSRIAEASAVAEERPSRSTCKGRARRLAKPKAPPSRAWTRASSLVLVFLSPEQDGRHVGLEIKVSP